jgi:Rne/Rng family ribonuclease
MSKELVIGSNRHETKVAVLEDDQLVEVYFERGSEYSLAGSIHKGKVTRVLPGMQSAFVDLGLERDTFLYVSDFFDEQEDIDTVADERSHRGDRRDRNGSRERQDRPSPVEIQTVQKPSAPLEEDEAGLEEPTGSDDRVASSPPGVRAPNTGESQGQASSDQVSDRGFRGERRGRRSRRRRQRGRGFPENKYAQPLSSGSDLTSAGVPSNALAEEEDSVGEVIVLPGESLAKYRTVSAGSGFEEPERALREEPGTAGDKTADAGGSSEPPDQAANENDAATEEELAEEAEEIALADHVFSHHEGEAAEEAAAEGSHPIGTEGGAEEPIANEARAGSPSQDVVELAPVIRSEGHEPSDAPLPNQEPIALDEYEVLAIREGLTGIDEPALDADLLTPETKLEESAEVPEEAPEIALAPKPAEERTATVREPNGRYMHRVSRRMRRRRGGNRAAQQSDTQTYPVPEPGNLASAAGAALSPETRDETLREDRVSERPERAYPSISDLLKPGQEIIVQIAKEPLGQKGARITSHIALPGRYVVFMPSVNHLGVSRKVASDEERQRLKRLLQAYRPGTTGGFIVRTAGEGVPDAEIVADMKFLYDLWLDIRKKAEKKPAPALLHYDLDVVQRILRDQVTSEFKAIWVDNEDLYENVVTFLQRFQPALVNRVKMYTRNTPIFDAFNITQELEKALRPKVWLKSGGYIVINQTEALVAIDINTGKYVGKSNRLEDTIVKTNTEAVKEIVRQIRLRDLGGIIVVDFIDMDERKNRQKVMQALEEAMRADKAPYKILQFNDFGLVAITRKRVKQSLERALCSPCPYCEGAGYVKSVQTVVSEILVEAQKVSRAIEGSDVVLRVHPEVAKVLKAGNNQYLEELEDILKRPVLVTGDPTLHHQKFDLA